MSLRTGRGGGRGGSRRVAGAGRGLPGEGRGAGRALVEEREAREEAPEAPGLGHGRDELVPLPLARPGARGRPHPVGPPRAVCGSAAGLWRELAPSSRAIAAGSGAPERAPPPSIGGHYGGSHGPAPFPAPGDARRQGAGARGFPAPGRAGPDRPRRTGGGFCPNAAPPGRLSTTCAPRAPRGGGINHRRPHLASNRIHRPRWWWTRPSPPAPPGGGAGCPRRRRRAGTPRGPSGRPSSPPPPAPWGPARSRWPACQRRSGAAGRGADAGEAGAAADGDPATALRPARPPARARGRGSREPRGRAWVRCLG